MNAKLIVEGKEFDIQILDPELQKLIKPPKKTGYERASRMDSFWYEDYDGYTICAAEENTADNQQAYDVANYYSDATVASNNARADTLMRQLRRFAVEHREKDLDWNDQYMSKWCIGYNYQNNSLFANCYEVSRLVGGIYFDRLVDANDAIDTFRDELIWLFTEYKDSL